MGNYSKIHSDIKEIGTSLSVNCGYFVNIDEYLSISPYSERFMGILTDNLPADKIHKAQERFITTQDHIKNIIDIDEKNKTISCFKSFEAMFNCIKLEYDISNGHMFWVGNDSRSGNTTDIILVLKDNVVNISIKTGKGSKKVIIPNTCNSVLNTGPSKLLDMDIDNTNKFLIESVKKSPLIIEEDKQLIEIGTPSDLTKEFRGERSSRYNTIRGEVSQALWSNCLLNLPIEKQMEFIRTKMFKIKEEKTFVLMCKENINCNSYSAKIIPETVDFNDNFNISFVRNKPYILRVEGILFGGLESYVDMEYRTASSSDTAIGCCFCLQIKGVLHFTKEELRRHNV